MSQSILFNVECYMTLDSAIQNISVLLVACFCLWWKAF